MREIPKVIESLQCTNCDNQVLTTVGSGRLRCVAGGCTGATGVMAVSADGACVREFT